MQSLAAFASFRCRRFVGRVTLLSLVLTLAPSRAHAEEEITDDLNTAAAVVGVGVLAADVGFTIADVVLATRNQRLSPSWSVVEIVCAAPIAIGATIYSFQARKEELLFTIPIAGWTAALAGHGIVSLVGARRESASFSWTPTYAAGGPGVFFWGRF